MRLHLDLDVAACPVPIQHTQKILLLGSCFTEHIGQRMQQLKFDCYTNPFGIVFSPDSMLLALQRISRQEAFTPDDLTESAGNWFSLDTHSSFNKPDKEALLLQLNSILAAWQQHLQTADWLILTFGSAYYYEHKALQKVVANCQKLPSGAFTKKITDPTVLGASYLALIGELRLLNPTLKVIITVSPVKHLRDGVVENSLSKAVLRVVSHHLTSEVDNCFYFPALELVADDLRDYRFYDPDMAHPNRQAIDYVWDKFRNSYFEKHSLPLLERLAALHSAVEHKPLQIHTAAFAAFRHAQLEKCLSLKKDFPYLNLEREIAYFSEP